MNKFTLFVLALIFAIASSGQNFSPVDGSSSVKFKIKNLGISVSGDFKGISGKINFDPNNPDASKFDVSVDAATVNTGIDMRDDHLKGEEYFDVKNYPKISFVSTKITQGPKSGNFIAVGNLTIKKVTKEISIPFKASSQGTDYVFEGEFKINRRDFEVGGGSLTMSDNLTVNLSVLARKE
ncbi:MAG: YceI family protein [Bacteroidetes bacterium]|nr:MAG: YceI family protein [Bacteroidota bacterium]